MHVTTPSAILFKTNLLGVLTPKWIFVSFLSTLESLIHMWQTFKKNTGDIYNLVMTTKVSSGNHNQCPVCHSHMQQELHTKQNGSRLRPLLGVYFCCLKLNTLEVLSDILLPHIYLSVFLCHSLPLSFLGIESNKTMKLTKNSLKYCLSSLNNYYSRKMPKEMHL